MNIKDIDVNNISINEIEKVVSEWFVAVAKYSNQTELSIASAKLITDTIGTGNRFKESDYKEVLELSGCDDPYEVPISVVVYVYDKINGKYTKSDEELKELYKRINFVISFAWSYMLEDLCTKGDISRGTETMDYINLAYIYLKEGYKDLTPEMVNKYYEENKGALYEKAVQLVYNQAYFLEKYMEELVFINEIPYPLPENFDFSKANRSALVSYFQNKKNDIKEVGILHCPMALYNFPEDLAKKIIGIAICAAKIMRDRQLM